MMAHANRVMTIPLSHRTKEVARELNVVPSSIWIPMVHVLHAKNIVELKEMERPVERMHVERDRN